MKTLTALTNIDKAKLLFELFRNEVPAILDYMEQIAARVEQEKAQLAQNWNNPFLSYSQWLRLATEVAQIIKVKRPSLAKSGNVFSEQLFGGYLAVFANHCMELYAKHRAESSRFKQAIDLFYLPEKTVGATTAQFLVLELHGGAACAVICTDQQGHNLIFDNKATAELEAADCQDGRVIEI